jgi:hypothetical protein
LNTDTIKLNDREKCFETYDAFIQAKGNRAKQLKLLPQHMWNDLRIDEETHNKTHPKPLLGELNNINAKPKT